VPVSRSTPTSPRSRWGRVIGEADLDGPEVDIALSNFARKGFGSIDSGELRVDPADPDADSEAAALAALADGETPDAADAVLEQLDSRGLVDHGESVTRSVTLTDDGVDALMMGIEATETVAQVTPELPAASGATWSSRNTTSRPTRRRRGAVGNTSSAGPRTA